ncbi:MAG: metal ABC transporter substrate-binding protein [Clostridia bacterium]
MKKRLMGLCLLAVFALAGCHRMVDEPASITVTASFYPIYALARGITRDVPDLQLTCLTQPQDGCLRSYQLSDWDAAKLQESDALLLGGRGLESFEGMLTGGSLPVLTVLDNLSLKGSDAPVPVGDDEASHLAGANPWAWMGVSGAQAMSEAIAQGLIQLDPGNARRYEANLSQVAQALDALKADMAALGCAGGRVALMHEGLGYFADTLKLTVACVIDREPGTDYEADGLAQALATLEKAQVSTVLIEWQAPARLVSDLEVAGYRVARIDTLSAHAESDADTYEKVMRQNAQSVAQALFSPAP